MTIKNCSIVGAGVAARALGPALVSVGVRVLTVSSKNAARTEELAVKLGARMAAVGELARHEHPDVIFLCVSDGSIEEVGEQLGASPLDGIAVVHLAAQLGIEVLAPAAKAGARTGKMHPIASLSGGPTRLEGVVWGIEAVEGLAEELGHLVERLDGVPMDLRKVDLSSYHLAAIFASNYLLALLGIAVELWKQSGAPLSPAQALLPLVRGTLRNYEELGLEGALTGPIARGDAETVVAQLRIVSEKMPEFEEAFRTLGLATVGIAALKPQSDALLMSQIGRLLSTSRMVD